MAGKAIKTAHDARKSYRISELQNQVALLEKLKTTKDEQKKKLDKLPPENRKEIQAALTKKQENQATHNRELQSKSKRFVQDVLGNALGVASTAIDFTALPRTLHSVHSIADALGTASDTSSTISTPKEGIQTIVETRDENTLRAKINKLSEELQVPQAKTNAELRGFVADCVADDKALAKITSSPTQSQGIEDFRKARAEVIATSDHAAALPQSDKKLTHVGRAFFGIGAPEVHKTPTAITPSVTPSQHGHNKSNQKTGP